MKRLINITGLPGSGKSTLAALLAQELNGCAFAADDFFNVFNPYLMRTDYVFDPTRLRAAHEACQEWVKSYLDSFHEGGTAIVHNTGSRKWERDVYRRIAETCGAEYTEIYVNSGLSAEALAARNVHKVPVEVIHKMRERWEF